MIAMFTAKFTKLANAQATVELALLSVLFVIVSLFCLNVGLITLGAQFNDDTCRDAARAAAQGDNYDNSLKLAQAAVATHRSDGYFISQPVLEVASFQYEDFSGTPPLNTSPYVLVSTVSNVRIPAPILFMGASFGTSGTMQFRRTYIFPTGKKKGFTGSGGRFQRKHANP